MPERAWRASRKPILTTQRISCSADRTSSTEVAAMRPNTRGRWDRREDAPLRTEVIPGGLWGAILTFSNRQGPVALMAVGGMAFLGWLWISTLAGMAQELRDHVRESAWIQRQSCISLSQLAGTPAYL